VANGDASAQQLPAATALEAPAAVATVAANGDASAQQLPAAAAKLEAIIAVWSKIDTSIGSKYPPRDFVSVEVQQELSAGLPYKGHYAERVLVYLDGPVLRLRLLERALSGNFILRGTLVCLSVRREESFSLYLLALSVLYS